MLSCKSKLFNMPQGLSCWQKPYRCAHPSQLYNSEEKNNQLWNAAGFTAACPPQARCQYLEWAVIKKLIKAFAHERSALSCHFTNRDGATLFSCLSGANYSRVISMSAISLRSWSFSTQQVRLATFAPSTCMPLKMKPLGTTESDCLTPDPPWSGAVTSA